MMPPLKIEEDAPSPTPKNLIATIQREVPPIKFEGQNSGKFLGDQEETNKRQDRIRS